MRFISNNIDKYAFIAFLMRSGNSEIHIPGNELTRFNRYLRKYVFCTSTLMGWYYVFESKIISDGFFKMKEISTAGVRFITHHYTGPLMIAHRIGATVG